MSISTKVGDKGTTSLWSGQQIPKDHPRVEAYGSIDELEAFLSETKHYTNALNREIIESIQITLKKVMAELATVDKNIENPINEKDIEHLENLINDLEINHKFEGFVTLGNTISSAKLDICRTIARRSERNTVSLANKTKISNDILVYLNRLSDLLFLMARNES